MKTRAPDIINACKPTRDSERDCVPLANRGARHREIQAVEASCFVHGTEDEKKVEEAVRAFLGVDSQPQVETLEGHFGNRILRFTWHLIGEDAWESFAGIMKRLGDDARAEVLSDLNGHLDEHGALYLRVKKQSLVTGGPLLSFSDPLRVRVKPRRFLMRGSTDSFYRALIQEATGS